MIDLTTYIKSMKEYTFPDTPVTEAYTTGYRDACGEILEWMDDHYDELQKYNKEQNESKLHNSN